MLCQMGGMHCRTDLNLFEVGGKGGQVGGETLLIPNVGQDCGEGRHVHRLCCRYGQTCLGHQHTQPHCLRPCKTELQAACSKEADATPNSSRRTRTHSHDEQIHSHYKQQTPKHRCMSI